MKECFICEKLKEKQRYKYANSPYTSIVIEKGINGKYRIFAYGEYSASVPCNYCPNCGKKIEDLLGDKEYPKGFTSYEDYKKKEEAFINHFCKGDNE